MDTVYHEIDECLELMPMPALPNTVPSDSKQTSHLKSKDDGVQTSILHLSPSKKITCSNTDMPTLNPLPECVLKKMWILNTKRRLFCMLISLSGEWEIYSRIHYWQGVGMKFFFSRKLITTLYLPSGKTLNKERKKQFTISNIL